MTKKILMLGIFALSVSAIMSCVSCNKNDDTNSEIEAIEKTDIFSTINSETIMLDGVINSKALTEFNNLYAKNTGIKTINIKQCDGSINDEINLELSKRIHYLNLNTHLMDNGLIASGGVDFFLAGIKRTKGTNTKIGVHSWAGDGATATDFPVGHDNHLPYINYYVSVGFTQQQAEVFYYFTINSASADNMHWMTEQEIQTYNILKN